MTMGGKVALDNSLYSRTSYRYFSGGKGGKPLSGTSVNYLSQSLLSLKVSFVFISKHAIHPFN